MSVTVDPVLADSIDTFPEQIAVKLEAAIRAGVYRPGQRLDAREIGAQYGASRRSTSRAFHLLAPKGYVLIRPNSGAFVVWPGTAERVR